MTLMLEETTDETTDEQRSHEGENGPGSRLRQTMVGVRLSISWLGLRRSLTREQKSQAARAFEASSDYVAASKKLLDTKSPAFQAVTAIRTRATALWKGMSLPFPVAGLRLMRAEDVETFDGRMRDLSGELREAVAKLEHEYEDLRTAARERLGSLYDRSDYPLSLSEEFALEWEFPTVEPPDYLRRLNPELYRRECQRVAHQFDQAVELAEQAFLAEFSELIAHLGERLSGAADGKPKVFRDTAVEKLHTFFARFSHLNIGSDEQLEQLVDQSQQLLQGVQPQQLRSDASLRKHISSELRQVESSLSDLMTDRPRRHLLREPK
ncbi:MAG: hypothetical protein RH917_00450 [Lacipirellulaceae bacterium]